jgi:hypothetical protein
MNFQFTSQTKINKRKSCKHRNNKTIIISTTNIYYMQIRTCKNVLYIIKTHGLIDTDEVVTYNEYFNVGGGGAES